MSKRGLHINKQRWKLFLGFMVLIVIAGSLILSNIFITKLTEREKNKARQWAESVRKKGELVELSNSIFIELKKKEKQKIDIVIDAYRIKIEKSDDLSQNLDIAFTDSIISANKDIPVVILYEGSNEPDENEGMNQYYYEGITEAEKDSISLQLASEWRELKQCDTIEFYEGMYLYFFYGNSSELMRLQEESRSLIQSFEKEIRENTGLIPVILWDEVSNSVVATNVKGSQSKLAALKKEWGRKNDPLKFDFGAGKKTLHYSDSPELFYLQWIPYVQFVILGLLILTGYFLFSTFRKAEQKRVWAGMAKETAHQLGTPLSSLLGWQAHLEEMKIDPMISSEMKKDLQRLERITDRFSKIGSESKLEETDIVQTINQNLDYLKARLSNKVEINLEVQLDNDVLVRHNQSLMDWVIENLCKNSVDAMQGVGFLRIRVHNDQNEVHIDVTDSGKGIPSKDQKAIFDPGYSTKKRGWGLGLALAKRIIHEHHRGKIYVLRSKVEQGTTIRITLPIEPAGSLS